MTAGARVRAQVLFAQIPEWILFAPELSAQAVRTYGVLLRIADRGSRQARAKHSTIAARSGRVSVPTVRRAIEELRAFHGAVEVIKNEDKLGRHANTYYVRAVPLEPQTSLLEMDASGFDEASEPPRSPVIRGVITGEQGPLITGDQQIESPSLEKTSPSAKSPIDRPTTDSIWLAEQITSAWGVAKGALTPAALQRLVGDHGARAVEDALRELHGFPPGEAVRSPYAYVAAMLRERVEASA